MTCSSVEYSGILITFPYSRKAFVEQSLIDVMPGNTLASIRTGCSGWSYKGWVGPFYPSGTKTEEMLRLYSRVFNTVEVDSTFYGQPSLSTVKKWKDSVPEDFLFTVKMPGIITHERKLSGSGAQVQLFLESIRGFGEKLSMVLIQLPPSMKYDDSFRAFADFVELLPDDVRFAVEFRDETWFREDVYSIMRKRGVTMAWSEIPSVSMVGSMTTSSLYLRLVGDRNIDEADFGSIRRDRSAVISEWADRVKHVLEKIDDAFVFTNNHFQGFGPATANLFRNAVGLDDLKWEETFRSPGEKAQKSLMDW